MVFIPRSLSLKVFEVYHREKNVRGNIGVLI